MQPLNAVPLVSVEYYRSVLDDQIRYGKDIEGSYLAYTDIARNQQKALDADAFGKVKDALTPQQVPGSAIPALPSDEAKIVASANDIEEQLNPFMGMPEAQKYRALIRSFVDAAQARNNKILEYNNVILGWQKLNGDIQQTQLDADAAQNAIADSQNPFVSEAENFMAKGWIDSKINLVRTLSQINRAYRYYHLTLPSSLLMISRWPPSRSRHRTS